MLCIERQDFAVRRLSLIVIMAIKFGLFVFCVLHFSSGVACSLFVEQTVETPTHQGACQGNLHALIPNPSDPGASNLQEISLSAFFSFPNDANPYPPTYRLIPAALLAVDEINNSTDILNGYYLKLDFYDTQCDRYKGLNILITNHVDLLEDVGGQDLNGLAMLGPGCTLVSESTASIAGVFFNLAQVSYTENLDVFSDRERYPRFFQTVSTIVQTTELGLVSVLSYFNWTEKVALVYDDSSREYTMTIEDVVSVNTNEDIETEFVVGSKYRPDIEPIPLEVFTEFIFESEFSIDPVRNFMEDVREESIRVIVGFLSEDLATAVICAAKNGTIPGEGFVYIFIGTFQANWWQNNIACDLTQEDVESTLIISSELFNPNKSTVLQSGKTVNEFKQEYVSRLSQWCPDYSLVEPHAATTYDSVWTIAKALDQINGSNTGTTRHQQMHDALFNTDFMGASGRVTFDEFGSRPSAALYQTQDGVEVLIAVVDENGVDTNRSVSVFSWKGDENATVLDDTPFENIELVSLPIIVLSFLVSFSGIIFGVLLWIFNWYHAKHKVLRASSQKLNYAIIIGVWFAYLSVIIFGVLESPVALMISDSVFKFFCSLRLWLLVYAFTLSFGTLFARAWRIYRIFNNPWISDRPLKDAHLLLIVAMIGIGDLFIVIPWTAIDAYRRFNEGNEVDYEDFSQTVVISCSSSNVIIWFGLIALYKAALMVSGVIIISLVKKKVANKKIYDDSTSLAVALYVSAAAFVLGLPLQLLLMLQNRIELAFIVVTTWVNISSSGTLISVFMPKVYAIIVKKGKVRKLQSPRSVWIVAHPSRHPDADTSGPLTEFTEFTPKDFKGTEDDIDDNSTKL